MHLGVRCCCGSKVAHFFGGRACEVARATRHHTRHIDCVVFNFVSEVTDLLVKRS